MKYNKTTLGKIIVVLGILQLFRHVRGNNYIGGYMDNTWQILIISLVLILFGSILLLTAKRKKKK